MDLITGAGDACAGRFSLQRFISSVRLQIPGDGKEVREYFVFFRREQFAAVKIFCRVVRRPCTFLAHRREECIVDTFAQSLELAQEAVFGFDIKDDSSLAYVSCLVALETVMPFSNASEIDFSITIEDGNTVMIDLQGVDIETEQLATINLIASHYFHSKRCNLPVVIH